MNALHLLRLLRLARLVRTPTGRRILAILFGIFLIIGVVVQITNPPPEPTSPKEPSANNLELPLTISTPPTDTLTITVTWDEWGDIQNAASFIQSEISLTLEFAGETLTPSTIKQSRATITRFRELHDTVIDQAEAQVAHIPDDQLDAILDHQLERRRHLVDLINTLDKARLQTIIDTLQ